ncbi:hypothetical protein ACIQWB_35390 [Streptomyces olivaceus]|uniref:hypothetical protein n=1 Tax=Streptomyces olivaceus TaxID=47716 RepID=UPI003809BD10
MTISLERPARRRYEPQLPVFGPTIVTNEPEPGEEERHAVLTLRIAVDRDMLAALLDISCYDYPDPDSWSVEFIRESVELRLSLDGAYEAWRDSRRFSELLDDPSVRDRIQAEYRAVDRAYPKTA